MSNTAAVKDKPADLPVEPVVAVAEAAPPKPEKNGKSENGKPDKAEKADKTRAEKPPVAPWTIADAADLYGINRWGQGYFAINDVGHVVVNPTCDPTRSIDLKQLVEELQARDIAPPLLIRFNDLIHHRAKELHEVFSNAIRDSEYKGNYCCVYPIKVNQQKHVVEQVISAGKPYNFGLEAGSKPELLAVMALVKDDTTPIICNGFKDDEFIEAVILAAKIGKNIIPVVEKFNELKLIAKFAKLHGVRPAIGLRIKLAARGAGRWESSGGDRSKFGLFFSEVIDAVAFLKENEMLDCLTLLHFHLGSQINNIRNVKAAIIELARVYCELHKIGATGLKYLDVGGGLGVDYDGSKSSTGPSINYSLQEYANDVVFHVKEVCDSENIAHPVIISESGRALVAFHSVLIFNVMGSTGFDRFEVPEHLSREQRKGVPKPILNLFDTYHHLSETNFEESYHDAQLARDETQNLFNLGYCSLVHRGLAERIFFGVCSKVLDVIRNREDVPAEFDGLEAMLARIYFCNFSIFQSLPDCWAIDQLFPIMPIHRLQEKPANRGILADVSCDSDGKIDAFIDNRKVKGLLDLHQHTGEDYFLGAFLVGAYQEILGDLHNLFGDTNAVHVSLSEGGGWEIEDVVEGDTVREVLHYVQFDADDLKRDMRKRVEHALRDKKLTIDEARLLLKFYENGLEGYTYLE